MRGFLNRWCSGGGIEFEEGFREVVGKRGERQEFVAERVAGLRVGKARGKYNPAV